MSSKSDKRQSWLTTLLRPPRSWSISRRLTAHSALAAFVILSILAVLLHWALVKSLERQSYIYLQDEVNVTRQILATAVSYHELEKDFEVEYAAREFSKTYARILDMQGNVLLQTYRMAQAVPVAVFPRPADQLTDGRGRWRSPGGQDYLLQSIWVSNGERKAILQVALEVSFMGKTLEHYRAILLTVVIIGTGISALIGFFIVRQGLQPLRDMTAQTRRISVANLNERLEPVRWPDELKVMASNFDEMLDRLKEGFDRLSSHISVLAHELRNPINILMGEADEALRSPRTIQEYQEVIESSLEEYGRLKRLIDSLLFIARFDISEASLNKEKISVCDEIHNLVSFYSPLAQDREIRIECPAAISLYADAALFRRAVGNLLTNSLQYTPPGGTISIVSARADRSVQVTVTDTGCGIDPHDLPYVFDRFYRGSTSKRTAPEGTGLGLATVKAIMSHHGGTITIETSSTGTAVTLAFPLQEGAGPNQL